MRVEEEALVKYAMTDLSIQGIRVYSMLNNVARVRRWTYTAVECYARGCVCTGCWYNDFFKPSNFKCRMKYTIIELVKCFGPPTTENCPSAALLLLEGKKDTI